MYRITLTRLAALAALIAGALRMGATFTGGVLVGNPAEMVLPLH